MCSWKSCIIWTPTRSQTVVFIYFQYPEIKMYFNPIMLFPGTEPWSFLDHQSPPPLPDCELLTYLLLESMFPFVCLLTLNVLMRRILLKHKPLYLHHCMVDFWSLSIPPIVVNISAGRLLSLSIPPTVVNISAGSTFWPLQSAALWLFLSGLWWTKTGIFL